MASITSSPGVSTGTIGMELVPLANDKLTLEKKVSVYAEVVTKLDNARERALPFKPATAFRDAYENLGLDVSGGKSVTMQKFWHLIQALVCEYSVVKHNVSRKLSLVIGARRHLERVHEKYILDTIQSHHAQIRLREYGVLDLMQEIHVGSLLLIQLGSRVEKMRKAEEQADSKLSLRSELNEIDDIGKCEDESSTNVKRDKVLILALASCISGFLCHLSRFII